MPAAPAPQETARALHAPAHPRPAASSRHAPAPTPTAPASRVGNPHADPRKPGVSGSCPYFGGLGSCRKVRNEVPIWLLKHTRVSQNTDHCVHPRARKSRPVPPAGPGAGPDALSRSEPGPSSGRPRLPLPAVPGHFAEVIRAKRSENAVLKLRKGRICNTCNSKDKLIKQSLSR